MSANISKISKPSIAPKSALTPSLHRLQGAFRAFLAGLTPTANVRLIHANGAASVWRVGDAPEPAANDANVQFEAREIPESLFLTRRLTVPRMSGENTESAILLEVSSHSPFATGDLAWGFAMHESDAGRHVDLVMASRKQIEAFLLARSPDVPSGTSGQSEIWAVAGMRGPVVLQGYGEVARLQLGVRGRRWNYGLLALAILLASVVVVTPTAQLGLRAADATDAFAVIVARATPLIRKRNELSVLSDRLRALEIATADKVDVTAVMEYLTKALPDDTYLYSLDVRNEKVVASGHTVDASALLQRLSNDPRVHDVRSPLAVTRQPGATKEAFTVEFRMVASVAPRGVQPAPASLSLPLATGGASN